MPGTTFEWSAPQARITVARLADWIRRRADGRERTLFGIAGPPGCGKSTIAERLGRELSSPLVPMDGFHLPQSELERCGLSHVKGAPETFAAADFVELVRELRVPDHEVRAPAFDRDLNDPVADQAIVVPEDRIVIVEGNYLLLDERPWRELDDLFDFIGYVDVPDDVRVRRLVARHVGFGRTPAEAETFVARSDERNAVRVRAGRARAQLLVVGE